MQKLSSGSNESSIFAIFVDMFFVLFLVAKSKKNMKIKLSPAPELNFCGPVLLKKRFMHLHCVSPFCDCCLTRIEYGGVRAARNAAHSTSSAYSDGGSLQKKSMGKSKKCALTVKQFSVTTWSLTSRKKTFFHFLTKSLFFTPSNSNAIRFS